MMSVKGVIEPDEGEIMDIELQEDFLRRNRELADEVRMLLDKYGVTAIDVMGSIGAGKTCLIEAMTKRLKDKYRIAMIGGDVATTIDSERVSKHGIDVLQINTGAECHLDANLIMKAIKRFNLENVDLLFIENVGNLICPADYPLGTHKRIVVISVTEGPYSIVKHPLIFREASICVINKIDLSEAMEVDPEKLASDAIKINPEIIVVKTSCKQDIGIDELIAKLGL